MRPVNLACTLAVLGIVKGVAKSFQPRRYHRRFFICHALDDIWRSAPGLMHAADELKTYVQQAVHVGVHPAHPPAGEWYLVAEGMLPPDLAQRADDDHDLALMCRMAWIDKMNHDLTTTGELP